MPRIVFLIAVAVLVTASRHQESEKDPRTVVTIATKAVRDSTDAQLRAEWQAALNQPVTRREALLGLATIARLTFDYDAAEQHYQKLFAPEGGHRDGYDIQARIGLGVARETQGKGGNEVAELYRTALAAARALGDSVAVGEALLRIGSLLAPMGGAGPGRAYLDSAVRALPASAAGLRAEARCRRSQYMVALMLPGGADSLAPAMEAARQAAAPDAQGFCLRATMVYHRLSGNADSAVAAEKELIALRRQTRDRSGLSIALMAHADHVRSSGRFGESNRLIREALAEARASKNRYIEATAALGLGGTALMMNDHVTAREGIESAIASFKALNDSASLMLALSYKPFVSMAAGDLDGARQQTLELIEYWRKHGDYQHLIALYRQLAAIEIRAGNDRRAERALDDAMAVVRRMGERTHGAITYDRARLAVRRGDLTGAEAGFRTYVGRLDSTERLPIYDGRVRLSEVFALRGDLDAAERELAAAASELDAWRESLSDPELRTLAFQSSAFESNDRSSSVANVLAALSAGGRPTKAFELAEHRRARELAERMARTASLRQAPASAQDGSQRIPGARAPDVAAITRAIPDDSTAILEFVAATGAPTTLFIVRRAGSGDSAVSSLRLPPADSLVGEIGRLVALIEGGEDPEGLERTLGELILDSALTALGPSITRLVIVPDGPLHRVPWDALRTADDRYVAQRYTVGIAPSAAIAASMWLAPADRGDDGGGQVLAFGDPTFADATEARSGDEVYRSALEATGGLPRLPNSAREARLVASYGSGAEVLVGDDATAAALKQASLGRFDVLHFATHALIDDRVVARNVLALGPTEDESGFLGAADLAALDLDAALVVLSACRSAGGVIVDGEGIQGLTAPLLQAGARSVVATAWRISDRATVPFVKSFYEAMAEGLPVASALRAAKLDAIERGAPPSEWAAFSVVGDPFMRVELVAPTGRPRWLVIAAVALVLIAVASIVGLRRRARRDSLSPAAA